MSVTVCRFHIGIGGGSMALFIPPVPCAIRNDLLIASRNPTECTTGIQLSQQCAVNCLFLGFKLVGIHPPGHTCMD